MGERRTREGCGPPRVLCGCATPKFMQIWVQQQLPFHVDNMRSSFLALLSIPFCLAAVQKQPQEQLADLAAAGNGDIHISDERTFDLLTAPHRNWSASIHFTALDKRRRCAPCKCVIEDLDW